MLKYGLGKHVWNISLADFSPYYLLGRVLAAVFYTTSMFFVKLSLLLLYRRVFDVERFYKRWWFVMIYTATHTITAIVLSFLACRPPDAQWDLHITHRKCISPKSLLSIPVFHCINDLLILSLPIPLVWNLNLNRKRKMQVTFVFALGSASCIVSILRIWPITNLVRQPRYGDVTWYWTPVAIWTQVELTFAITCACVPVLKPFLSRLWPAFFSSSSTDNNANNNANNATDAPPRPPSNHHLRTAAPAPPRWSPTPARPPSAKTIGRISTRVLSSRMRGRRTGGSGDGGGARGWDIELGVSGGGGGASAGVFGSAGGAREEASPGISGSTAAAAGARGGIKARVSEEDGGSEVCIVKDVGASPASEARSSTVCGAEGVCGEFEGVGAELERDAGVGMGLGVDVGRGAMGVEGGEWRVA
ncbi:integral membrane protein [Neofusicoccum parvum]|nr:integral membrane protein [Neofusicoccum parvum]